MSQSNEEVYLKALCNDRLCQSVMYLTSETPFVDCFRCGQQHSRSSLQNLQQLADMEGEKNAIEYRLDSSSLPKRGHDMVKVLGLSNYYCKLLSPFLTMYGMDKATGQPKLLRDMGKGDIFDCSSLSSRAFLIDSKHISIPGFGRDVTGSMDYLSETLQLIKQSNGDEERLLPIYADGDGHCLVHAISRALVGRELFWHPLRSCLKRLFENNLDKFKELFENFIGADEWQTIIEECDPDFKPPEGDFHGLRNIHIFGLANVLRRPIILLDSWECMNKSGDYSGLFLPGFVPPEKCRGEDNTLNKPICIAWSSKSHNHYIPLVGILNMPLPVLPRSLIPSVFRMPQTEIASYIEFDESDNCVIGGSRVLSDSYMQCLVFAMETQFSKTHGVNPSLVADAKHFFYSNNVVYLNTSLATVIHQVRNMANEGFLYRCSSCTALNELSLDPSWFRYGGVLYTLLLQDHKKLVHGSSYIISWKQGNYISCKYDSRNDVLVPDVSTFKMDKCNYCQRSSLKRIERYVNQEPKNSGSGDKISIAKSDQTSEKSIPDHPQLPRIKVQWNDETVEDVIPDFQLINEEILASEVDKIVASFIKKHFTGDVADKLLQSYISGEIYKTLGKTPTAKNSTPDLSQISNEESNMEIEKAVLPADKVIEVSNNTQSEPLTSQMQTVKLVSISGRQVTLDLNEKGISYGQLQEIIKSKFSIPVPNQRIKMGFPPKLLEPPHGNEGQALPLKHGDRLIIENHAMQETRRFASTPYIRNNAPLNRSTECNSELWRAAKLQPHLFKRGGLYFEEANQKHILCDLAHVGIETFPNKQFSYNYKSDCLEICLKPYGHFEIGVDLDSRSELVMKGESVRGFRMCPIMLLKTGSKDTIFKKNAEHNSSSAIENNITPQTSAEIGRIRKGPGISVLTSPKSSDMDLS